ncbi:DUF294 nucleotidyltransferase-like domain-containing protein [Alkalibacter mobilis]|uniref:DUF294 nucleotidyltransferase-like domain-containing protein n=1 Tax=Alkalibacter mobilis TaxID=2787712 RepID=UPI0018A00E26|nr:DUF294 nucleotidyltransferase-like domain-containing protein [Alkalibacter mobilis]MBF7096263.1 hypothetical protein [Alkalibacter mobilis]
MKRSERIKFADIDSDSRIRDHVLKGLDKGEDLFDLIADINKANDEKKVEVISEVIEEMKKDFGYPPSKYCWIEMGSAGRREQIFRTDQDNALIYESGENDQKNEEIDRYFKGFSKRVNKEFEKLGFAPCPGDVMAENNFWRGSMEDWQSKLKKWTGVPKGANIRNLTIFLDFRPLCGSLELGYKLRNSLNDNVRFSPLFLTFLARDACSGILASGKEEFNVKTGLLVHLVDCVRVFAIKEGLEQTNTADRIKILEEIGVLSPEFSYEITDALEFIMRLKLYSKDNVIDPERLNKNHRKNLEDAFKSIKVLRRITKEEFIPDN